MPTTLHLIKSPGTGAPWDLLSQPAPDGHVRSVVLIQDAVTITVDSPVPIVVLAEDAATRGVSPPYPVIDDEQLIEMILAADTVIVW